MHLCLGGTTPTRRGCLQQMSLLCQRPGGLVTGDTSEVTLLGFPTMTHWHAATDTLCDQQGLHPLPPATHHQQLGPSPTARTTTHQAALVV